MFTGSIDRNSASQAKATPAWSNVGAGLPPLPMFHINLHLPRMSASDIALELSRHIREQFAARYRRAA